MDPRTKKEWADIRDRSIEYHTKLFKESIPGLDENDFTDAKDHLAKAREFLGEENYVESVIQSYKAMEKILYGLAGVQASSKITIDIVMKKYVDLRKHGTKLDFVRNTRNRLVHANGIDECDETAARFALEGMDQFLRDVEGRLR